MQLLVEGLGVGKETSLEKYIIAPIDDFGDDTEISTEGDVIIKLYGHDQTISLAAKPIKGQNSLALIPQQRSTTNKCLPLMDPLVTLFTNVHEKFPEAESMGSSLFPHLGSMFSVGGNPRNEEDYDEESSVIEGEEYPSDAGDDSDDNIQTPLISRQATTSSFHMRHGTFAPDMEGQADATAIGGGWQLAWKWPKNDEKNELGFKRIYLHQEGILESFHGTMASIPSSDPKVGSVKAVALVGQAALYSDELVRHHEVGPAMVHPLYVSMKGTRWSNLTEPGVKHALVIGIGIQLLQQV